MKVVPAARCGVLLVQGVLFLFSGVLNAGPLTEMLSLRAGSSYQIPADSMGTNVLGNEAMVNPDEGDTVTIDGTDYVWTKVSTDDSVWGDEDGDDFIAYWTVGIVAFVPGKVKLKYSCDEALKVWLYGELVVDQADAATDKLSDVVELLPGKNRLTFKLYDSAGPNKMRVNIADTAGQDMGPGKYAMEHTRGGLPIEGALLILTPQEGDAFAIGQEMTIRWVIDPSRLKTGIAPYVSLDGGLSWISIAGAAQILPENTEYYSGDTGTFVWTVPDSVTDDGGVSYELRSDNIMLKVYAQYEPGEPVDIVGPITEIRQPGEPAGAVRPAPFSVCQGPNGAIVIRGMTPGKPCRLALVDTKGRTILSGGLRSAREVTVEPENLHPGMYLLVIQTGEGEKAGKLLRLAQ